MQLMSDTSGNTNQDQVMWDELVKAVLDNPQAQVLASIPKDTRQFILDPINRNFIVQSVLTSLINADDPEANTTHANEIADLIIRFARELSGN